MKYLANFSANNGTHLAEDMTDSNLKRITKKIYEIANDERFKGKGSQCEWQVYDENGKCRAAGYTLSNGYHGRVHKDNLKYYDIEDNNFNSIYIDE